MPCKPEGDHTLTGAERMRRWCERHADGAPSVRFRRPKDRRSRAQRWRDAVVELLELQAEYFAWLDALPPSLEESTTAEALRAIVEFDLGELETLGPPRGYGQD